jgi:hypothetical protein
MPKSELDRSAGNEADWAIERCWLLSGNDAEGRRLFTADLGQLRSLALLGSAGSGKSFELRSLAALEQATGRDVRHCRLAAFCGSSDELARSLQELSDGAGSNTIFYLDALDEAMVALRRAWLTIGHWIRTAVAPNGAGLRITCRAAIWPGQMESAMESIGEADQFAVAWLQPLNDDDIRAAAVALGLRDDDFLAQVAAARAGTLARHPLSLRMLLKLFSVDGALPSGIRDLFRRAMRTLVTEQHERFEYGTASTLQPDELLAVAERVACYTLLSGRDTIALGDHPTSDAISWSELDAADTETPRLSRETLAALGASGLCDSASPTTFRFGHRQYAEHLAGRRLGRLLPHQAQSLLANPGGWKSGVAGPLRETAAFAAMESAAVASWVATTDPEVIGLSDIADDELRREATLRLLEQCRNGTLNSVQLREEAESLQGLRYRDAEKDLRPRLRHRDVASIDELECAIELIRNWQLASMDGDLAELMLDDTAPLTARVSAGYSLLLLGTDDAKSRVKPLAFGCDGDTRDELRGLALRSNWPARMSVDELLNALVRPRDESYTGAYEIFLWQLDREGFRADGARVRGLVSAKQHLSTIGDADPGHRIVMRIAHAATGELDEPETVTALVDLLQHCVVGGFDSPLDAIYRRGRRDTAEDAAPESEAALQKNVTARRQLIEYLASAVEERADRRALIWQTPGLIAVEDFGWILSRAQDTTLPVPVRMALLELADSTPWRQQSHCIDTWLAVRDIEPIRSAMPYPTATQLDSDEATAQRAEWSTYTGRRNRPARQLLAPPPRERVGILLDKCENEDPAWFNRLCDEMTLEATSTRYDHERVLTQTPGWRDADDPTRARIVEAAKRFLSSGAQDAPEKCRDAELNSVLPGCMAAIWLLQEFAPDWFLARDIAWWRRWRWYILREIRINLSDEPSEPKIELLTRLYDADPEGFREELVRLASSIDERAASLLEDLLGMVYARPDTELDWMLLGALQDNRVSAGCVNRLSRFLLARCPDRALPVCTALLKQQERSVGDPPSVQAAIALLHVAHDVVWPELKSYFDKHPNQARVVLTAYADNRGLPDPMAGETRAPAMTTSVRGELLEKLFELFPPDSDPHVGPMRRLDSVDMARHLRDRLLSNLAAGEDADAVASLRRLEHRFADRWPWLSRPRAEAERSFRLSRWRPLPIPTVAEMLSTNEKRLLHTVDDVLDGIEVAIDAYARAIRRDSGVSVDDLWNTPHGRPPTPKAEEHVSAKICAAIRQYFADYAVTTDREVEIHRRALAAGRGGESGSEVDVLVHVPARGAAGAGAIRVPIEVKLSHNSEVKTAMEAQLVARYLPQVGATAGIYVVAWMDAPPESGLAHGHRPKWDHIESARADLAAQAESLSTKNGVVVRPLVVDLALR